MALHSDQELTPTHLAAICRQESEELQALLQEKPEIEEAAQTYFSAVSRLLASVSKYESSASLMGVPSEQNAQNSVNILQLLRTDLEAQMRFFKETYPSLPETEQPEKGKEALENGASVVTALGVSKDRLTMLYSTFPSGEECGNPRGGRSH